MDNDKECCNVDVTCNVMFNNVYYCLGYRYVNHVEHLDLQQSLVSVRNYISTNPLAIQQEISK